MIATQSSPLALFARLIFGFVALNALSGAASLLFFPEQTDLLFFWTITPAINAHLFGALYLAGALVVGGLALRGEWEMIRFLTPVLVCAGLLIALVTFVHIDRFAPDWRLWYWLLVYIGAPLLAIIIYVHHTYRGSSWAVEVPVMLATHWLAVASGWVILIVSLGILLWPAPFVAAWPWPITALMLRVFAAWLAAFGVGLLWFLVEHDWRRMRPLAHLMIMTSMLHLSIVALHHDQLLTTGPRLWLYCGHLVGLGLLGVLMQSLQERPRAAAFVQPVPRGRSTFDADSWYTHKHGPSH